MSISISTDKVAIYALIDGPFVTYVGQSIEPKIRVKYGHWPKFGVCSWRVLRWADSPEATRIEYQIIQAYRRKGQCLLNKRISFLHYTRKPKTRHNKESKPRVQKKDGIRRKVGRPSLVYPPTWHLAIIEMRKTLPVSAIDSLFKISRQRVHAICKRWKNFKINEFSS